MRSTTFDASGLLGLRLLSEPAEQAPIQGGLCWHHLVWSPPFLGSESILAPIDGSSCHAMFMLSMQLTEAHRKRSLDGRARGSSRINSAKDAAYHAATAMGLCLAAHVQQARAPRAGEGSLRELFLLAGVSAGASRAVSALGCVLLDLGAKGHRAEFDAAIHAIESKSRKLCGFAMDFERQSRESKAIGLAAMPAKRAAGPRRM